MMNQSIPDDPDWSFFGTADIEFAYEKFHGKSIDEMTPFVSSCPTSAYGYLEVMPAKPFQYYIQTFLQILDPTTPQFTECYEKAVVASCFLHLIGFKLEHDPESIVPIMDDLIGLAKYISTHQSLYEASFKTFGSFEEYFEVLNRLYEEHLE